MPSDEMIRTEQSEVLVQQRGVRLQFQEVKVINLSPHLST